MQHMNGTFNTQVMQLTGDFQEEKIILWRRETFRTHTKKDILPKKKEFKFDV